MKMTCVLCRVVWADEYKSENEKFYAGNMKYPAKHKTAHELLNFANEGGYVYGFVENNKSGIKLTNLGASPKATKLGGVTVIWCALDKQTRQLRVVGWYDDAVVFSEPQSVARKLIGRDWHYQFRTKTQDAHLIPPAERFLEVPRRMKRKDKGFIGQRNWHFPEHSPNYERFLEAFASMKLGQSTPTANKIDQVSFEEGQRATAELNIAVRNPKLVAAAKKRYGFRCQVCDFSFEDRYGELGKSFIEVHHLLPMSSIGKRTTSVDDVRVVCANCHRMIHRGTKALDIAELKKLLQ